MVKKNRPHRHVSGKKKENKTKTNAKRTMSLYSEE